jgi:hypothetical protein
MSPGLSWQIRLAVNLDYWVVGLSYQRDFLPMIDLAMMVVAKRIVGEVEAETLQSGFRKRLSRL